ncbi:MAG TPA: 30S ribosomal protein S20 [Firmicutes bacterium]|nr:30S ribosomal protein S20 [Candidatus Fermentithermobacillaceae bacterium]
MANTKSAEKRARQSEKRCARNMAIKSAMRTAAKKFRKAVEENRTAELESLLRIAQSRVDKAVSAGVIHKRTGARYKSRLYALLRRVQSAAR